MTRTAEMWLACPASVYAGARVLSARESHAYTFESSCPANRMRPDALKSTLVAGVTTASEANSFTLAYARMSNSLTEASSPPLAKERPLQEGGAGKGEGRRARNWPRVRAGRTGGEQGEAESVRTTVPA